MLSSAHARATQPASVPAPFALALARWSANFAPLSAVNKQSTSSFFEVVTNGVGHGSTLSASGNSTEERRTLERLVSAASLSRVGRISS